MYEIASCHVFERRFSPIITYKKTQQEVVCDLFSMTCHLYFNAYNLSFSQLNNNIIYNEGWCFIYYSYTIAIPIVIMWDQMSMIWFQVLLLMLLHIDCTALFLVNISPIHIDGLSHTFFML